MTHVREKKVITHMHHKIVFSPPQPKRGLYIKPQKDSGIINVYNSIEEKIVKNSSKGH